jgi:3-oxoacyl-[acyl-carrier protein] reductase
MEIDLSGQRALVTGGTRGIGHAIVGCLSECGAHVTAVGRDRALLDSLPRNVVPLSLDLADAVQVERAAPALSAAKFDILINNAGINLHALIGELELAEFDKILAVNLRSAVALSRAIVPGMAERGYGRVVNITSVFSIVSKRRRASYATSKFALLGFTKTLALDYADRGVLANSVAPGFIGTEMTERMLGAVGIREMVAQVPVGRLGDPREVGALVAFLASPLNSFINGQNIAIDGGFTST